jgi:quinolinate synthase
MELVEQIQCESDTQFESTHPYRNKIPAEYLQMSVAQLKERITSAREKLGDKLFIMAHHYQKDEVVEFAEAIGDSLYLAQRAAENKVAEHIVFCGVHFMAETAVMLTESWQHVYLPDENAGCYMADMATRKDVEKAWEVLLGIYGDDLLPITYVNSTAEIKAFVGEHGGTCVTSTNAAQVVQWALDQGKRILFVPDQHLGRNTGYKLGVKLEQMALYKRAQGELVSEGDVIDARIILWDGYCGVHQQFTLEDVENARKNNPEVQVIVHPECRFEVVQAADLSGSTNKLIQTVESAEYGTSFAIGTDNNLVSRLKSRFKGVKDVSFLNPFSCPCVTMNRIRLPHLAWNLDSIIAGDNTQEIQVDETTTKNAKLSLDKMFELS